MDMQGGLYILGSFVNITTFGWVYFWTHEIFFVSQYENIFF